MLDARAHARGLWNLCQPTPGGHRATSDRRVAKMATDEQTAVHRFHFLPRRSHLSVPAVIAAAAEAAAAAAAAAVGDGNNAESGAAATDSLR